jgi:hypothetical protein
MLRRSVVPVLVVLALLVGADFGARQLADSQLASRGQKATSAQSADASVGAFPFLYHLLGQGRVARVDLHLHQVPIGPLRFDHVDVALSEVRISRNELFTQRRVRVTSIDRASVSATTTAADLTAATGVPVAIGADGSVTATVAGVQGRATLALANEHLLVLRVVGRSLLRVDLAANPLMPACAMTLAFATDEVTATCVVQPVPPTLLAAMQR